MAKHQVKEITRQEYDNMVYSFLCELLNPEGFGWSVTQEVRTRAKTLKDAYNSLNDRLQSDNEQLKQLLQDVSNALDALGGDGDEIRKALKDEF